MLWGQWDPNNQSGEWVFRTALEQIRVLTGDLIDGYRCGGEAGDPSLRYLGDELFVV